MSETCDMEAVYDTNDEEEGAYLLRLPQEMFLHICSFLGSHDIIALSKTCRKLNCILQSESIWRGLMIERWGRSLPLCENWEEINWKKRLYFLEKDNEIFRENFVIHKLMLTPVDIDTSLLLKNGSLLVTGSRDGCINVFDSVHDNPQLASNCLGHAGWVWKLKYHNNNLYSSSWDHTIKIWDFNERNIQEINQFTCESAALSLEIENNGLLFGGSFNYVSAYDTRIGPNPIYTLALDNSPVLTLNMFQGDLVVGCENKTMAVWDLRTRTSKKVIKLSDQCYACSSQVVGKRLFVGDRKGYLRIFEQTSDNPLAEIAKIDTGYKKVLIYIKLMTGAMLTCSHSHFTASLPFKTLTPISKMCPSSGLITSVDYSNGILVLTTSSTIEIQKRAIKKD